MLKDVCNGGGELRIALMLELLQPSLPNLSHTSLHTPTGSTPNLLSSLAASREHLPHHLPQHLSQHLLPQHWSSTSQLHPQTYNTIAHPGHRPRPHQPLPPPPPVQEEEYRAGVTQSLSNIRRSKGPQPEQDGADLVGEGEDYRHSVAEIQQRLLEQKLQQQQKQSMEDAQWLKETTNVMVSS